MLCRCRPGGLGATGWGWGKGRRPPGGLGTAPWLLAGGSQAGAQRRALRMWYSGFTSWPGLRQGPPTAHALCPRSLREGAIWATLLGASQAPRYLHLHVPCVRTRMSVCTRVRVLMHVCTRLFLHLTRLFVCFCTYTHLCMCLCMLCTHRCLHTRAREGGTGSRVRHSCRWWGRTLRPCWDGRYSVLCVSGRGFAMAFRPRALGCTEEPGPRVGAGPALCRPSSQEAAWLCPGQRPLPSCGRAVQPPGESRGDGRAPSPLRVSGPRSRAGPPSGGAG